MRPRVCVCVCVCKCDQEFISWEEALDHSLFSVSLSHTDFSQGQEDIPYTHKHVHTHTHIHTHKCTHINMNVDATTYGNRESEGKSEQTALGQTDNKNV